EPADDPGHVVEVPAPREAPKDETAPDPDELHALDAFLREAAGAEPQPPAARTGHRRDRTARPAGEEPEEPETPQAPQPPAETDELVAAEAAALRDRRFGLAGWLREAAGRPDAEAAARW